MKFHLFFSYLGLMIMVAQSEEDNQISQCPDQTSYDPMGNEAFWHALMTNAEINSSPLCLDEKKYTVRRTCLNDGWKTPEPPDCDYTQKTYDNSNKCPLGYDEIRWKSKIFCILVTIPQAWNNTCLSAGSSDTIFDLDTDEEEGLHQYLNENGITNFWMPARQIWKYSPIVWTLPGEKLGEIVKFNEIRSLEMNISDTKLTKECFSVNRTLNGYIGTLEPCELFQPILCIHRKMSLIKLACPDKFRTTRYEKYQNLCFSTHMILNLTRTSSSTSTSASNDKNQSSMMWVSSECRGELYVMNSVEKIRIFEEMSHISDLTETDRCLFGIARNTYIASEQQWINMVPSVPFVNWADTSGNGSVVTVDQYGKWHWTSNTFSCIACQRRLDVRMPHIELDFQDRIGKLFLIIYDEKFFWRETDIGVKCFTNSDYEMIKSVEIEQIIWNGTLVIDDDHHDILGNVQTKTVAELNIHNHGPGYYWCEGFAIPNFKFIHTEKIVAFRKQKSDIFSVLVDVKCPGNCEYYLNETYPETLALDFQQIINEIKDQYLVLTNILIHNVRLMHIENIDIVNKILRIVFHVTTEIHELSDVSDSNDYLSYETKRILISRNILQLIFKSVASTEYHIRSVNSTEYCLPEHSVIVDGNLNWNSARIGEAVPPIELCVFGNGLSVLRQCVGDFIYGGNWKNLTKQQCQHESISQITRTLYEIEKSFSHPNEVYNVIRMVRDLVTNYSQLVPVDLYYLSKIMAKINIFNSNNTLLARNDFNNIFAIYNSLMQVNENITKTSAALNATNILLDAFDTIVNNLPAADISFDHIKLTENLADGIIAMIMPKLIVYVIEPNVKNISGIALFRNKSKIIDGEGESNDFTDFSIMPIYKNQSSAQLLEMDDLEIGSFVPQNLLNRLNETKVQQNTQMNSIYIVITVYYKDNLFQEFKNVTYAKSGGKIISISIPGYGPMLPVLLPIFIRTDNFSDENAKDSCGYWRLKNDEGWSTGGCDYNGYGNNVVLCTCSHLTHFAYLILGTYVHSISLDDDVIITQIHQNALDMITLLGCSLSLLGIIGIYITALIFPFWREKASSKVLLHLSTAIGLQMVLLCFVNTEASSTNLLKSNNIWGCIAMGSALHYSVLVAFSWMLITAYLQFMRYVRVLGQTRCSRFFLKSFICGWIIPLFPVLLVVLLSPNSYIPDLDEYANGICYPSGLALHLGVVFPIAMVMTANLAIFIIVLWNIMKVTDGNVKNSEKDIILSQLRLSILLFFLLGLTWFFGLLATTRAGLAFSYLFCLIATLQGFVLFLYFIILDPATRNLWNRFIQKHISMCSKRFESY